MQSLQKELGPKGLKILLFPCNQFNNQEPGSNESIKKWINEKYPGDYLVFKKSDVNGENANQVFSWLRRNTDVKYKGNDMAEQIQWNFEKFIISVPEGKVVGHHYPKEPPFSFKDELLP